MVRIPAEKGDSILYLFYLLEAGKKAVRLYVHQVDSSWETGVTTAYEILHSPGAELTGSSYRLLWSFVDSLLPKGVKTVYFSPDGIYYRINVASLYDGRQFVIDRYAVQYVARTRRLLIQRPKLPSSQPVIIGNPAFDGKDVVVPERGERSYRTFTYGIPPLPGAEEEAQNIARLLNTPILGSDATEKLLKSLRSPHVLHIATHGYFEGFGKNPMIESGLLLAQAALWDSLYPPLGIEDGRFTAQEASTLNLLGTALVVLSACETGLGTVRGDGLYGLQRAFLEAGASRVITTLWQIDDQATQALMEDFYRRWIELSERNRHRHSSKLKTDAYIDEAFAQTIRSFRKRYPEPYYWGAFVLMQ